MHEAVAKPDQEATGTTAEADKFGCGILLSLRSAITLSALLLVFLLLEFFIPLPTSVQIGADEGFELAKATLCLNGHHLYTR